MNTTTPTRTAPRLATVALGLAVAAMATVVLSTSAVAEFTIYADDFSGDAASTLNGTTPDVAPIFIEWFAGDAWKADGSAEPGPIINDPGGAGAYLPFEPEEGRIYTLSGDITNQTSGRVGFGFLEDPTYANNGYDNGRLDQGPAGTQWIQMYSTSALFMAGKQVAVPPAGTRVDEVSGLTGTNSYEIILDVTDADNVQVSFSVDNNLEHSYNAGPLATMGTSVTFDSETGIGTGTGIHGVGLSVAYATSIDTFNNFLLTVDVGPPTLGIRVNTGSGAITMLGPETGTVDLSYYDITSAGNSLDEAGWNSLAAQDYDGNGPPDDSGNGWEEGGSNGAHGLAEGYLLGSSTFGVGASVGLGNGYDVNVDAQDLFFTYSPGDGPVSRGLVQYVDLPGDFDFDGDVDGADLLLWQRNTSVGALGDWQDNYGTVTPPLAAAASAVPEPVSLALLGLGGLMLLYRLRA